MIKAPYLDPQALSETIVAVKNDPTLGHVTFSLAGQSAGGLRLNSQTGTITQAGQKDESRAGKFKFSSDEPTSLLGSDTAVSPAEYVMKGLAGCYAVTLAALASEAGIALKNIEVELEFDVNLSGFLGIDSNVRPGAQQIRVDVSVDSPGTPKADIQNLIARLQARSPIRDTLANPVNVVTTLK